MKEFRSFFLPILAGIFLSSCAKPPERNCSNFKTGSFSFTQKIAGKTETTYFSRTEDLQIETFNAQTDTASVRWINGCEYILSTINPKTPQEKRPVHIKILTTTDSSYTFEFNIVGESEKLRGTAIKTN